MFPQVGERDQTRILANVFKPRQLFAGIHPRLTSALAAVSILIPAPVLASSAPTGASGQQSTLPPVEETVDPETASLKQLFDDAQVAFLAGRHTDAAKLFDSGYERSQLAAFLFNAAVAWERADQFDAAIERYAQYLVKSPSSEDTVEIRSRIDKLRASLDNQEEAALENVTTKGVTILTTKPDGAELRLDDPGGPVFAHSPFRGTLPKGEHTVHVRAEGFKDTQRSFPDNGGKVLIGHFELSEKYFLGHLEVQSPVAGADVYIQQLTDADGNSVPGNDNADVPVGTTPFATQLPPGKWAVKVQKLGYENFSATVEIGLGKVKTLQVAPITITKAILRMSPKTGASVGAQVYIDEQPDPICSLPCDTLIAPGTHELTVKKDNKKNLEFEVSATATELLTIDVNLEPRTKRHPAVVTGVLMAGAAGVGTYFALQATKTRDALQADIDNFAQIDADDPRAAVGRRDAIIADASFLGTAIMGGLTLYYLFRETGEPSTGVSKQRKLVGKSDIRSIILPAFGPGSIGFVGEVRF